MAADRQIRVFISSTFRDMHAERDHLVTVVFPELRERVEQLRLEFFDVDLRWGVPAQDANGETANSWEYCRQWIDRVEPFFVCILGQRYGWVPEPEQLKTKEDSQLQHVEKRSITEMEVRHAVLNTKLKRRSYFYLRATNAPANASEYVDPPPLLTKLEQLKNEVRSCGRPVRDYPCEWTGSGFVAMEEFGCRVLDDLWSGVLRDERYVSKDVWRQVLGADPNSDARYTDESKPVPHDLAKKLVDLAKPAPFSPLDAEKQQMETFAQARLRWFQGRTKELKQLTDFVNSTDEKSPRLAVVTAVPGQGKSALQARLHEQLKSSPHFVITHFVGATERSASAHALVERLLGELDRSGITWTAEEQQEGQEPKRDFNRLCLRLAQGLGDYAGERRIVVLLDALNQLSNGHDLNWLPHHLGPGVRVIVSCIADAAMKADSPERRVLEAITSRPPAPLYVPLGLLTEEDVRTIVVAYLAEYCHELDREHLDTLCAITQARTPLYLLVMLNELRTLGGNDLNRIVPALIASMPQYHPDTVSLFRWVLQRLEVFGPEAVRWWCLYLAHGRVGMAHHELADLLVRKLGADAAATSLRIERGLRRYLQRRGPQLDFFHGQLRQAVFEQYGPQAEAVNVHSDIATYFHDLVDPERNQSWKGDSPRPFSELPLHLVHARKWSELIATLEDIFFLEAKVTHGLSFDLLRDFADAVRKIPGDHPRHRILCLLEEALMRDIHFIARHAKDYSQGLFQCLWNSCWWLDSNAHTSFFALDESQMWSMHEGQDYARRPHLPVSNTSPTNGVGHNLARLLERWQRDKSNRTPGFLWLRSCRPPSLPIGIARSVSVALEPEIAGSTQVTVRSLHFISDRGRLLTGSSDGKVEIWDSNTGLRQTAFKAQSRGICKATVDRQGQFVALASWDGTIQVHDWRSGMLLRRIEAHSQGITGITVSPHGHLLASFGADKCINVWDRKTGARVARHQCEQSVITIHDITWGCDEHALFFTDSFTVWRWDHQCSQVKTVASKVISIESIACSPDGKYLACGSSWGPVVLLDSNTGQLLHTLRGHAEGKLQTIGPLTFPSSQEVRSVTFSHDGSHVASAGADGTVRVWNAATGVQEDLFLGHDDYCWAVSFSGDGKKVASASQDATVRVWERGTSCGGAVLIDHAAPISGIAFSPDGRTMATCSEDSSIGLWEGLSGVPLVQMKGHDAKVIRIEWSPDSRFLLSGGTDAKVRIWDMTSKSEAFLRQIGGGINSIGAMCWFPGSSIAVYSDSKGTIYAYDVSRRVHIGELRGHFKSVTGISIVPQLALMASCSMDGTIRVWSLDGRHEPIVLQTAEGKMWGPNLHIHVYPMPEYRKRMEEQGYRAIQLSSDGSFLASVGDDGKARVWHIQKAKELRCFHPLPYAGRMAISRNGRLIATSSIVSGFGDQKLEIWNAADGTQVECLAGVTDIAVVANTLKTHPWIVLGGTFETVVISAETRRPLAYYPSPLRNVSAHPEDGHLWAGSMGHHLDLLRIDRG
jgi:WD40 repeat protein